MQCCGAREDKIAIDELVDKPPSALDVTGARHRACERLLRIVRHLVFRTDHMINQ
jgi:hypothetical protein